MSWIVSAVLNAVLNWLVKFITGLIEGWQTMIANEKRNAEIKKENIDASTPAENQNALNDAAKHLGHHN